MIINTCCVLVLAITATWSWKLNPTNKKLFGSYGNTRLFTSSTPYNPIAIKNSLQDIVAKEIAVSTDFSELPNSFEDMVKQAASRVVGCINSGSKRMRIDIDTTVGDLTYTSIKNALPVVKELVKELSIRLDLSLPIPLPTTDDNIDGDNTTSTISSTAITEEMIAETMKNTFNPDKTLRIFFPDMGAAALVRRDWKFGSALPEVPPCVFTANIQNDPLMDTDKLAVILSPRYSETEYVKRVMDMCDERGIPCLLVNPELINMDQGYGVRARNVRKAILSTFTVVYKLQTLKLGAVVRDWPHAYSVWYEDSSKDEGYTLLKSFSTDPSRENIDELFDEQEELKDAKQGKKQNKNTAGNVVNEMMGFFKGLSKL